MATHTHNISNFYKYSLKQERSAQILQKGLILHRWEGKTLVRMPLSVTQEKRPYQPEPEQNLRRVLLTNIITRRTLHIHPLLHGDF
jgi:hypothetical protein